MVVRGAHIASLRRDIARLARVHEHMVKCRKPREAVSRLECAILERETELRELERQESE